MRRGDGSRATKQESKQSKGNLPSTQSYAQEKYLHRPRNTKEKRLHGSELVQLPHDQPGVVSGGCQ